MTYKSIGVGSFYTEFFDVDLEVEVLKAEEADYYILVEPYFKGYDLVFQVVDGKIYFDMQPMGFKYEGTEMTYWLDDSEASTVDGNTFKFVPYFYVPSLGGGFGEFTEILVLK